MNILLCRINAHGIGMTQHTAILFRGTVYNCYNDIRAVCLFLMLRKISFSSYILFSLFVPDRQENLLQIVDCIPFDTHVHITPGSDFG